MTTRFAERRAEKWGSIVARGSTTCCLKSLAQVVASLPWGENGQPACRGSVTRELPVIAGWPQQDVSTQRRVRQLVDSSISSCTCHAIPILHSIYRTVLQRVRRCQWHFSSCCHGGVDQLPRRRTRGSPSGGRSGSRKTIACQRYWLWYWKSWQFITE